jgi:type VI protein secretion system component Hcp
MHGCGPKGYLQGGHKKMKKHKKPSKKLAPAKKLEKKVTLTTINIDGLKGESTDASHKDWIDITGFKQ